MIIGLKLLIVVGVGRRRGLEVGAALHQRGLADGQQQPIRAVQVAQAGALSQLSRRSAALAPRRASWHTSPAAWWRSSRHWCCCSRLGGSCRRGDHGCFHLFIISTFPLAVPLEWNVLFAYATIFLFLGFPAWNGYSVSDMTPAWLAARGRRRAAVLPDSRQLPARQGVVPAVDAAVRRQLGVGGVGVRPGRRGEAQQGHPHREEPGRPVHRIRLRTGMGRCHDAAGHSRGAPCTARAAVCSRCC